MRFNLEEVAQTFEQNKVEDVPRDHQFALLASMPLLYTIHTECMILLIRCLGDGGSGTLIIYYYI